MSRPVSPFRTGKLTHAARQLSHTWPRGLILNIVTKPVRQKVNTRKDRPEREKWWTADFEITHPVRTMVGRMDSWELCRSMPSRMLVHGIGKQPASKLIAANSYVETAFDETPSF